MKPFLIGRYQLGWRMVNLFAEPDQKGAWFNLCLREQDSQIRCGMDYSDPAEAFSTLCHEVWEMVMDDTGAAFKPKSFCDGASDVYRFFFDHNQHTEICARASFFVWNCIDDFKRAHRKCQRSTTKHK